MHTRSNTAVVVFSLSINVCWAAESLGWEYRQSDLQRDSNRKLIQMIEEISETFHSLYIRLVVRWCVAISQCAQGTFCTSWWQIVNALSTIYIYICIYCRVASKHHRDHTFPYIYTYTYVQSPSVTLARRGVVIRVKDVDGSITALRMQWARYVRFSYLYRLARPRYAFFTYRERGIKCYQTYRVYYSQTTGWTAVILFQGHP